MKLVRVVAVSLLTACSSSGNTADPGSPDTSVEGDGAITDTLDAANDSAVTESGADATSDIKFDTANKTVFVTSMTYSGDLGGIAGADAKCQALADAATVSGTFKAWLSTTTSSPATTFTRSSGDYVLPDRTTVVAHGWDGLTSGTLLHAIDQTEAKSGPPITPPACGSTGGGAAVWTGTLADGTLATGLGKAPTCADWTSGMHSAGAAFGTSAATTTSWSLRCTGSGGCDGEAALYCFEQ